MGGTFYYMGEGRGGGGEEALLLLTSFYTYPRRHTPYGNQTDYRIFELNKRLQNWTEVSRGKRRVRAIWAPLWDIF